MLIHKELVSEKTDNKKSYEISIFLDLINKR